MKSTVGSLVALVVVVVVASAIALACGGGGAGPACTNGDTRTCVGPGACAGAQFCTNQAWSSCDCGGPGDGGPDGMSNEAGDAIADGGPDITPYLKNCVQVSGSAPSVEIPAGDGGTFCIDSREVSAEEVDAERKKSEFFKQWGDFPACIAPGAAGSCANGDRTTGQLPANCVVWCDAAVYCERKGKHICAPEERYNACLQNGEEFPWGKFDAGNFQTFCSNKIMLSSESTCHPDIPPQSFVTDLVANAIEWSSDPGYTMVRTNANNVWQLGDPICGVIDHGLKTLNTEFKTVGFRCCGKATLQ